ncbi:hypothetical protein H920_20104 [Fukomys damarensis]|uniref:Uncharacterized protein n=1 Tax=Fukomys damarensis TaxID=885580 RepID=A0A091CJ25_FUKDA|nr:hypothetical protein H920_20104 [Fukomys damarensis]
MTPSKETLKSHQAEITVVGAQRSSEPEATLILRLILCDKVVARFKKSVQEPEDLVTESRQITPAGPTLELVS